MTSIVRDRRVENSTLAGRTDRRDAIVGAEPRAQLLFGDLTRLTGDVCGGLESNLSVIDH